MAIYNFPHTKTQELPYLLLIGERRRMLSLRVSLWNP